MHSDERVTGIGHVCYHLQEALEFLRDNKGVLFDKVATETFFKNDRAVSDRMYS